jgi:cytochrome c oxidase subunit 2
VTDAGSTSKEGEKLFTRLGCVACHVGDHPIGPALGGVAGSMVELDNGKKVLADDDYIRESILDPNAKIVKGFTTQMPTFKGLVNEDELTQLIAYVKSLKNSPPDKRSRP